jgi:cation:H+ antiporter
MFLNTVLLIVSLGLLYWGAAWLVRGSASAALRLGLTPLVVGLTIVAYGTSTPELLVSTKAALAGQGDIALGNVIGSNIFNVAVILGLAALIHPMKVQFQLIKLDTPIMIFVSVLLWVFFQDGRISRPEAALLLFGIVIYTAGNIYLARRETTAQVDAAFGDAMPAVSKHWAVDVGFILGGLVVLMAGSRLLVDNATSLARAWGVSEAVIGLTIVAAGTSMPELATSVVAAFKKQPDIAIGNVIGSNIYNILCILGVSGLLAPLHAPGIRQLDLYAMLIVAVATLPILWSGLTVRRREGALLLAGYGVYLAMLWPK